MTQPSRAASQMNNCLPGSPVVCNNIWPATQAFGLPDAGGMVVVVFTGKVAAAPERSTLAPVKVLSAVKVLGLASLAEAVSKAVILVCRVVSAPVARVASAVMAAPSVASATARVAASAATAASECELAEDRVVASPALRAVASLATEVSV